MSSRRQARSGPQVNVSGFPVDLMEGGKDSPVWHSPRAAQDWLRVRHLPPAPQCFEQSPRALRDHAADVWGRKEGLVNAWGYTDWEKLSGLGIPPAGGARAQARFASP